MKEGDVMTLRRSIWHLWLAVAVVATACGGPKGQGGDAGPPLECEETEGLPCSPAETSREKNGQTAELIFEGALRLQAGETPDEVVEWLEGQPEMASVQANDVAIRFRLKGAREGLVWLEAIDKSGGTDDGDQSTKTSNLVETKADLRVLQEQRTRRDGLVAYREGSEREEKRALVLAPFQEDFYGDQLDNDPKAVPEADVVAGQLRKHDSYNWSELAVDIRRNQRADLLGFADWRQFDVVHVSTHGVCHKGKKDGDFCEDVDILTGRRFKTVTVKDYEANEPSKEQGKKWLAEARENFRENHREPILDFLGQTDFEGVNVVGSGFKLPGTDDVKIVFVLALGADFFRSVYGHGIEKKFVFISACRSLSTAGADLAEAMVAPSSTYLGWSKPVNAGESIETAKALYEKLSWEGLPAETALEEIGDKAVDSDGARLLRLRSGARRDVRIREVVQMRSPDADRKMEDGDNITPWIDGVIADGKADRLDLDLLVEGFGGKENELGEFKLRFEFNGKEVGKTYVVEPNATRIPQISEAAAGVDIQNLELGRDLEPGRDYTLKAILELPEGGESIHEVENLVVNSPCRGEFRGPGVQWDSSQAAPDHQFGYALVVDNPDGTKGDAVQIVMYDPEPYVSFVAGTKAFDGPGSYKAVLGETKSSGGRDILLLGTPDDDAGEPMWGTLTIEAIKGQEPNLLLEGTVEGPVDDDDDISNGIAGTGTASFSLPMAYVSASVELDDPEDLDPQNPPDISTGGAYKSLGNWKETCGLKED